MRPAARRADGLLAALAVAIALVVHRRALGAFFGTDDFVRLEEAAGLLPQARTLWRLLSEVLYIKTMLALFGPRPLPFHVVSMALHLVNTAFVFRTGRRAGLGAAGSFCAATFFGAFPLFYTVLPSAVNVNDVMALTLVFLALLALETPTLARGAAGAACFLLALLSKEAVVFVPFSAVLLPRAGESPGGAVRRLAPLLVTGAGFAALYLAFRGRGLGTGGEAYAVGFGANLFHNLMTYVRWSVDLARAIPAEGTFDAGAWRIAVWPLAALALAAALSRSRRGVIGFGCAWWLLGLLPVLPLVAHAYGHYLYVPVAGLALAAAGALEALADGFARLARREPDDEPPAPGESAPRRASGTPAAGAHGTRAVPAALAFLALVFAARSEALIGARAGARLGASQLALDPFTRKMEIARRAVSSVVGRIDRDHDTLVVFTPQGFGHTISSATGERVAPSPPGAAQYDVIEAVLGGGIALRLFETRIDSVVFASRWLPAYRNFTLFFEGPAGQLANLGRGAPSHARLAGSLLDAGYRVPSRDYLDALVLAFPGDRRIRLLYAAALLETGDPVSARSQALRVVEGAPPDSLSAMAYGLLAKLGSAR